MAGIARELNEQGVLCPSAADQPRNRHRSGEAWIVRTVAGILANPRYTGRQVWNRHGTDDTSHVTSAKLAHTPLVDEATFSAVQGMRSTRRTADGTARTYVLAGLLVCGTCGRRMDSHWTNQRAGYRCRHGHTSARPRPAGHPKNVYIRQDHLLAGLRRSLNSSQSGWVEWNALCETMHTDARRLSGVLGGIVKSTKGVPTLFERDQIGDHYRFRMSRDVATVVVKVAREREDETLRSPDQDLFL